MVRGGFGVFGDFLGESAAIGKIVGDLQASVTEPKHVRVGRRPPDPLTLTSVFLCGSVLVAYTVYRIISVALGALVVSFTTESPARINLLITSQQTGILWLGFGYPPTSVWRLPESTST
jgi:hypothetical protein